MAILNGYEGPARVELKDENLHWKGYILLEPNSASLDAFHIAGLLPSVIYEGPVLIKKKYTFASGEAKVVKVEFGPEKLKVEFEGVRLYSVGKAFRDRPVDFLSEE
jgi:hypothetical protein